MFDGTMTWAPFVQQTIAMVRDHRHNYKRGPGFFVDDEGNTFERQASETLIPLLILSLLFVQL